MWCFTETHKSAGQVATLSFWVPFPNSPVIVSMINTSSIYVATILTLCHFSHKFYVSFLSDPCALRGLLFFLQCSEKIFQLDIGTKCNICFPQIPSFSSIFFRFFMRRMLHPFPGNKQHWDSSPAVICLHISESWSRDENRRCWGGISPEIATFSTSDVILNL